MIKGYSSHFVYGFSPKFTINNKRISQPLFPLKLSVNFWHFPYIRSDMKVSLTHTIVPLKLSVNFWHFPYIKWYESLFDSHHCLKFLKISFKVNMDLPWLLFFYWTSHEGFKLKFHYYLFAARFEIWKDSMKSIKTLVRSSGVKQECVKSFIYI